LTNIEASLAHPRAALCPRPIRLFAGWG
jgi:hypothetical protein